MTGTSRRRSLPPPVGYVASLLCLALLCLGPVAWERLPQFALFNTGSNGAGSELPADPSRRIDPDTIPERGTLIEPQQSVAPSTSSAFQYFELFGGQPPKISTCEPIEFVIRRKAGPPNGDDLVFEALQRLADETGISFEWGGFTNDLYDFNGRNVRYPWEDRHSALWIGWAFDDEIPDLGPTNDEGAYAVGVGGPIVSEDGEILGGGVVLRADEAFPAVFGAGATTGNVLLHELGHALGLDHVADPEQLMFPTMSAETPDGFADGDRAGLQSLVAQC